MNEQRKKAVEGTEKTQVFERTPDVASDDDTQQVRTLTVEELERLLRDEEPD